MIYKKVSHQLRALINSDEYQIGDVLPSEKRLAERFEVSRMTLRRAMEVLIAQGMVMRLQGSGTYIQQKDLMPENIALSSFAEQMKKMGRKSSNQVIEFAIIPAPPAIASQLRIKEGMQVYFSRRVRYMDDNIPRMIEDSYMPVSLYPNLSVQHLEGSKFAYIEEERNITIAGSHETFFAVLADSQQAKLLNVQEGTPLLQITSLSDSNDGRYLDLSIMVTEANQYRVGFYMQRIKQ